MEKDVCHKTYEEKVGGTGAPDIITVEGKSFTLVNLICLNCRKWLGQKLSPITS